MVNINGLEQVNGENYPLDIWSLYMQNAVSQFPVQQFDVPSPSLDLEKKTDGRACGGTSATRDFTSLLDFSADSSIPESERCSAKYRGSKDKTEETTESTSLESTSLESTSRELTSLEESTTEGTSFDGGSTIGSGDQNGPPVQIPNLETYFDYSAEDVLTGLGFKVKIVNQPQVGYQNRGVTYRTDPAMGTTAPRGSTVTVYATPNTE